MAANNDLPVSVGDVIHQRYEIAKRIGQGGMASVFKAKDIITGRYIALKLINGDVISKETGPKRLEIERESLARLADNPNVVALYDLFQYNNLYFIAMELLEGGTLKNKLLDFGKMTLNELKFYFGEICKGLSEAHKLKIIHRDIKPDNVLISSSGEVKISDFGISIMYDNKSGEERKSMGTPKYMSPEQVLGFELNNQSDIYSLGIMLYEFATGVAPFSAPQPKQLAVMHVNNPVIPPKQLNPNISQDLENVIMKATAKNTDERYKTVEEFAKDLLNANENSSSKPLNFRETFDFYNENRHKHVHRPATSRYKGIRKYLRTSFAVSFSIIFFGLTIILVLLLVVM